MFYDTREGVYMKGKRFKAFFNGFGNISILKARKSRKPKWHLSLHHPRTLPEKSKSRKVAFKENLRQNVKYLIFRVFSPFKWRPGRHSGLCHKIPLKWILMLSATCHESWNMRTMFKLLCRSFSDALSNVHNFTTFVLFANAAHSLIELFSKLLCSSASVGAIISRNSNDNKRAPCFERSTWDKSG